MARYKNVSETRKTHRAKKNWAIIDVTKFLTLVADGRAKGALPNHGGECLFKLERWVRVGTAFGAYTERQARLYASNGGTWSSVELLRKAGQKFNYKYFDSRRYAAVEIQVLGYLRKQVHINWDISAVRQEMYEKIGEAVLESLCTSFIPPASTLAELKAEAKRAQVALDLTAGQKPKLPTLAKPVRRCVYRIVDLDDFRHRMAEAYPVRVHEGQLFRRATSTAVIQAGTWQRAIDTFRYRLGGDSSLLPYARFIAVSEFEWQKVVELQELPPQLSRGAIRQAIASSKCKKENFIPKWVRIWEAGCDDGQYGLPYYTLKELIEFPLKPGKRQKPLITLTPAERAWRPRRQRVKPMKQLALTFPQGGISPRPFRMRDKKHPNQYLLFF